MNCLTRHSSNKEMLARLCIIALAMASFFACEVSQKTECLSNGETVQVSTASTECPSDSNPEGSDPEGIPSPSVLSQPSTVTSRPATPLASTPNTVSPTSSTVTTPSQASSPSPAPAPTPPLVLSPSNPPIVTSYFAITARTSSSIGFEWEPATDDRTPANALQYRVVYSLDATLLDSSAALSPPPSGVTIGLDWTSAITSANLSGLSAATDYYVAVFVRDGEGKLGRIGPKHAVTNQVGAPIIGTAVAFSNLTPSGVTLNWGAASDVATPTAQIEYRVVEAASVAALSDINDVSGTPGTGVNILQDWTANITSYAVTGLHPGTDYAFAVVSRGTAGTSSLYDPSLIKTSDLSAPTPGSDIVYTHIASTTLTAAWGAATDDATSQSGLKYKLVRASTSSAIDSIAEIQALTGASVVMDWAAGITSTSVSGLSQGQIYYFNYLVMDAAGNIGISNPVRVVTFDAISPSVSGTISYSAITESSATVSWSAATDGTNVPAELEYKLVRATSAAAIDTLAEADAIMTAGAGLVSDWSSNSLSASATGLSARTPYFFAVIVRDPYGNRTLYPPTSMQTIDTTPPLLGAAIYFTDNTTETSVTVNWGAATDNGSLAANLQYKLVRGVTPADIDTIAEAQASGSLELDWTSARLNQTIYGLTGYTEYYFAVLVRDQSGNVSLYAPGTIQTLDTSAPVIGSALLVSNVERFTATVNWGAGSDTGGSNNVQYKVVRASAAASIDSVAKVEAITGTDIIRNWGASTSVNASGLLSLTTHYFTVIMRDGAGNKALYSPVSFTTRGTIFVTQGEVLGDMNVLGEALRPEGPIGRADYFCNHDANKPANSKTYKALLVLPGVRVACTTTNCAGGISERLDWPLKPLTTYKNLADQVIDTTGADALFTFNNIDTGGLDNQIVESTQLAWTGMKTTYYQSNNSCSGWTSRSSSAFGGSASTDSYIQSVLGGGNSYCNSPFKLYCVEQ